MLEAAKNLFLIVSALFPIVDPLGGSPFFLAMTVDGQRFPLPQKKATKE
jgi:multiple antibiotic resistance protein